jgi:hypothetical protein
MLLVVYQNQGFTGVQAPHIAGEGDDLHPVQILIGGVITEDHRGTLFPDLPADGWVKIDPPDLTADHR